RIHKVVLKSGGGNQLGTMAELFHQKDGGILIQHLVQGCHDAHLHERLDKFTRFQVHALGEVGDGNRLGHLDFARNEFRGFLELVLVGRKFLAAATTACTKIVLVENEVLGDPYALEFLGGSDFFFLL